MKKLAVAIALVCAVMTGCGAVEDGAAQEEKQTRFEVIESEYVYSNSYAKILVDNETGVMYLVMDVDRGAGITVMVNSDGKPLILEDAE